MDGLVFPGSSLLVRARGASPPPPALRPALALTRLAGVPAAVSDLSSPALDGAGGVDGPSRVRRAPLSCIAQPTEGDESSCRDGTGRVSPSFCSTQSHGAFGRAGGVLAVEFQVIRISSAGTFAVHRAQNCATIDHGRQSNRSGQEAERCS